MSIQKFSIARAETHQQGVEIIVIMCRPVISGQMDITVNFNTPVNQPKGK